MALDKRYFHKHSAVLRDARPWTERTIDALKKQDIALMVLVLSATFMYVSPFTENLSDILFLIISLYFYFFTKIKRSLPYKLPKSAKRKDPNFQRPDGSLGMADGILYLGNETRSGEEVWFTNSDARTHCLYLGTTGSGKTFGLKSYSCNALTWASGFIYIDGKADTSLWSTISAMARRFGRDDDLLIMNYMTGNVAGRVPSNTLNPFSSGSASYLTNMLTSLMPDSEGDNAMWKDRAIALVSSLMPCLVWKRDNQNIPLSIAVIRTYLTFKAVIKLSRDPSVPEHLRVSVKAYLAELPGYVDNVFDDNGDEKPAGPGGGGADTSVPRQQHGYLSMQFTRSMQSLGDDYGFIFDTQAADIDIMDVVLQRRILIVLIPALEKSSDETANLGKIISSTLKGMMGATLGSTVEGESSTVIDNKPTNSATPFIAIFDEVGYYTAQGMAVMAAQARSLGFSLVFAGQDLPAMEKRVKEEARSITANCNIKLFGKLEDPTQTKEFFDKTVGSALVVEVSGYSLAPSGSGFVDSQSAGLQSRAKADYDTLKGFNEGKAICAFGKNVSEMQVYNSDIGDAKAMRVQRFLPIPPPAEAELDTLRLVDAILKRFRNPQWKPAEAKILPNLDIEALARGFSESRPAKISFIESGMVAVAAVAVRRGTVNPESAISDAAGGSGGPSSEREAAAAVVLQEAGTQPLKWGEVIGEMALPGTDARPTSGAGAHLDPAKMAAAEQKVAEAMAARGATGPLNWMDVIGAPATETKAPPSSAEVPPLSTDAGPLPPASSTAEAKAATTIIDKGIAPMSWGDLIGAVPAGDEKKDK